MNKIESDPSGQCQCSIEKIERVLKSLGREELESMLREQGGAEVTCHFCKKKYLFSEVELKKLLTEM